MKVISLTGFLGKGMSDIGGENTGWFLQTGKTGDIEVDVSEVAAKAGALIGQFVLITGYFITEVYPERGATEIFIAKMIKPTENS